MGDGQTALAALQAPLVGLDRLKATLQITDDVQDALLKSCLVAATSLVTAYVRRPLLVADYIERHRRKLQIGKPIILRRYPVLSVESVIVGSGFGESQSSSFDFDPDTGLLDLYGIQTCETVWLKVSYRAGYIPLGVDPGTEWIGVPVLPLEISEACLIAARALYYAPRRGDPTLRSESIQGVGSSSWLDPDPSNGGLPVEAAAMLSGHRFTGFS